MELGAVRSGYAGATYAYRRRESPKEEFYNNFSSMAQKMESESENDGKVIGFATFPCGNSNVGYDMIYSDNAQMNGIWEGNGNWEELEKQKAFYQSFIRKLEKLQEGEKGNHTEAAGKSNGAPGEKDDNDLMQLIRERMEKLLAMLKSGDTEASFQIGNSSFTIKEWEKFLERFDDIEDAIRELMRERIEKRKEETEVEVERKAAFYEKAGEIDALVSESTRCTYPASVSGQEDTMYITWYTEEGIFCRKAGQREGYEWSVRFEKKEDYNMVMEFLNRFDRKDNLRFAARRNFWQDFLKGEINPEGFMDFYEGMDSGVA